MRTHLLASAIALLGTPCTPTGDLGPIDDSAADDSGDTAADDTGMGPCESGFCELTAVAVEATCQQPDEPTSGIETAGAGAGILEVVHYAVQPGCCPTLAVTAIQDLRHSQIDVTYEVSGDDCQCICQLDFRYTLVDAQPGTFTLNAGEDSVQVEVP